MTSYGPHPTWISRTTNAAIRTHLRSGKSVLLTVSTNSMWPAISAGDRVRVRAVKAGAVRPGDILMRRIEETWIVHRLIRCVESGNRTFFVTKGDSALTEDQLWSATPWVDVVVAVERGRRSREFTLPRASWRTQPVVLVSRSRLLAARIEKALCRWIVLKLTGAALRAAVWLTR